jgi:hypothetical protein
MPATCFRRVGQTTFLGAERNLLTNHADLPHEETGMGAAESMIF